MSLRYTTWNGQPFWAILLYIHAKKPASLYVGNIIFIFIETITTNFNIFYGIIANQGANTMITPKTTTICLPNDTIFGAFHAKKFASLSIMSAVTYRTTPNVPFNAHMFASFTRCVTWIGCRMSLSPNRAKFPETWIIFEYINIMNFPIIKRRFMIKYKLHPYHVITSKSRCLWETRGSILFCSTEGHLRLAARRRPPISQELVQRVKGIPVPLHQKGEVSLFMEGGKLSIFSYPPSEEWSLTLAGAGHFASFHDTRGGGGGTSPSAVSPLIEVELRGKKRAWCRPPRDEAIEI